MQEEGRPPWHTLERRRTGGSRVRGHDTGHDDHDDQEDQPPADSENLIGKKTFSAVSAQLMRHPP